MPMRGRAAPEKSKKGGGILELKKGRNKKKVVSRKIKKGEENSVWR